MTQRTAQFFALKFHPGLGEEEAVKQQIWNEYSSDSKCRWRTHQTHLKGTLAAAFRLVGEVTIWRTFSRAVSPPAARNAILSAVFWRNTNTEENQEKLEKCSHKGYTCEFCRSRKSLIHSFIMLDTFEKEHFTAHVQGRGFLEQELKLSGVKI